MADKSKPLILLIHGAWHQPAHYAPFVSELERRGFPVQCPRLPSAASLTAVFDDDVRCVRDIALESIADGRDVIGIMHSYGGKVGTRAFSGLGSKNRSLGSPATAAVSRLVYLAASIPPQNGVLDQPFESSPNQPTIPVGDDEGIRLESAGSFFYNDLSPDQQETWLKLLVPHAVKVRSAGFQPLGEIRAAWWDIPVTQIICDNDQAISWGHQERMLERIQGEVKGVADVDVDIEHCDSGHSPFLSMPEKLADMIERICEGVQAGMDG